MAAFLFGLLMLNCVSCLSCQLQTSEQRMAPCLQRHVSMDAGHFVFFFLMQRPHFLKSYPSLSTAAGLNLLDLASVQNVLILGASGAPSRQEPFLSPGPLNLSRVHCGVGPLGDVTGLDRSFCSSSDRDVTRVSRQT